mmetsp:Transcript_5219/g.17549  ORF Transcript_5219/g.17549 Transcript_5219/m.17549 type:complete len:203 (-) Transcript_5219:1095-1703(-)
MRDTRVARSTAVAQSWCGAATWPFGRTRREPTLSCMDTTSLTAVSLDLAPKGSMRRIQALMALGRRSAAGSVAEHQTVLKGDASMAATMLPVTESLGWASPEDWSEPMVGSSSMSTVSVGLYCLRSHAAEAMSHTNMRGGRSGMGARRLRMRSLLSSWRSMPSRSFWSICFTEVDVDAPRRPQSQEQVMRLLCTQAKGTPWL